MESPFRTNIPSDLKLIETFGWFPDHGFRHLERHFARMMRSAVMLGWALPEWPSLVIQATVPQRCRLTFCPDIGFEFTHSVLGEPAPHWMVAVAQDRLQSTNPWRSIKSTQRLVYDAARSNLAAGIDEQLFLNEKGEVCEGTITNIFIETVQGQKLTPDVSCGLLPGILREVLIQQGFQPAVLTLADVQDAKQVWMGNDLRGLIPATIVID